MSHAGAAPAPSTPSTLSFRRKPESILPLPLLVTARAKIKMDSGLRRNDDAGNDGGRGRDGCGPGHGGLGHRGAVAA